MSHKYIHEDLNKMINKYFDNKKENGLHTENYKRCIFRHKGDSIKFACLNGNINIIKHLMNQTTSDLSFFGFYCACAHKNFELMNFFLGNTSDVDEMINHAIIDYGEILNEFFDKSINKNIVK